MGVGNAAFFPVWKGMIAFPSVKRGGDTFSLLSVEGGYLSSCRGEWLTFFMSVRND
jgi:hypothetical protein